jgi:DNA-binding winged helix-turn-helix (wHTH) protein
MMYLFDDYTMDTQLYELRHAEVLCPLEPQVFDILLYLIQHRDRVVPREELLEHVWPERFISEATLDHRVMEARQAIGDSGQRQCRIKTLRGRGYRFVASVEESPVAGHQARHTTAPQTQGLAMACGSTDGHPLNADARGQPRRSRSSWCWRSCTGVLVPLSTCSPLWPGGARRCGGSC